MPDNKTKATDASVAAYLEAIADESRCKDCEFLIMLMTRITKHKPVMWGPSIVGFDSYHYRYESGREGDACVTGFSSRKPDISIYLAPDSPEQAELLGRLGKHKMGKSCLAIRRLGDIDTDVLEQLIVGSVAAIKQRYS